MIFLHILHQFRKDFYVEVPEIKAMTDDEVFELRVSLDNVRVKGKNCPKPIRNWAQAGLRCVEAGVAYDVVRPGPNACRPQPKDLQPAQEGGLRQAHAHPGPDGAGHHERARCHWHCQGPYLYTHMLPAMCANTPYIHQTGSGKTLAFLLPMYRHIMDQRPLEHGDGPIALIMAPTRELAVQIYSVCWSSGKTQGGGRVLTGGVEHAGGAQVCQGVRAPQRVCVRRHRHQRADCGTQGMAWSYITRPPGKKYVASVWHSVQRGAEIIVCTPGRMIDMLCANNGRVTNLVRITYLVLDEADRMFDMVCRLARRLGMWCSACI